MSLEYFLNQIIRLDPYIEEYLTPLENKAISITCTDLPNITLYCLFVDKRLELTFNQPDKIDTIISAPLAGLVNLAVNKHDTDLRAAKIVMYGDLKSAQALQQLFFKLDIDWEEELAKLTGDIFAHQAIYIFKQLRLYKQESAISLENMVTEYLQEESGLLPTHYEINDFIQEVDQLRLQADRLEARIKIHEST